MGNKTVTGKVIYIDNFGNIITNIEKISLNQVLSYDNKIMAFIGDKQVKLPFVSTYDLVKKGDFLATIGSSNLLEIAQNQGNAAKKLGIKVDDEIKILLP